MTVKREPEPEPPANLDAERCILGAVLLDNAALGTASMVEPEDFFLSSHGLLWSRMQAMAAQGMAVDIVTLVEELRANGEYQMLGETPAAYIASLTEGLPRLPAVKEYARIVRAKSLQRRLLVACQSAINKAYAGESGFTIISVLRDSLDEIESTAKRGIRA